MKQGIPLNSIHEMSELEFIENTILLDALNEVSQEKAK